LNWTRQAIYAVLTVGLISPVAAPQLLAFPYSSQIAAHRVYSEAPIAPNLEAIVGNADRLAARSPIAMSKLDQPIFLTDGGWRWTMAAFASRSAFAISRAPFEAIVVNRSDQVADKTFRPAKVGGTRSLTGTLAHEMTHCLQANKYGIIKFNPFKHPELWKLEGYPEYISRHTELSGKNYSLTSEINRYMNLMSKATGIWILSEEGGCEVPNYYYKGRLMIEYLMDIRHLSYDNILNDTVSENTVYQEMIKWKDGIKETQK